MAISLTLMAGLEGKPEAQTQLARSGLTYRLTKRTKEAGALDGNG